MIKQNIELKQFSTLKVGGNAEYYTEATTQKELLDAVNFAKENYLNITILGSASNIIISDEGIKGLVIKLNNKNIELLDNNQIKAGAGVIWDDLVKFSVQRNLYGIENLSLIPGTVGASAVQNIGAYGQEVAETVMSVKALDLTNNNFIELSNNDCRFSYRQSIFNSQEKGRYVIFEITYKLAKSGNFSLGYQDMAYFREDKDLSLEKVRNEIIKIRTNKLPDYNKLPNVGSFFKNPIIREDELEDIIKKVCDLNPEKGSILKGFTTREGKIKIPAGLLIEACGLKGYRNENMGIYDKHALIVIHHSKNGTCQDVLDFSRYISETIKEKTGITIEREPTVIG